MKKLRLIAFILITSIFLTGMKYPSIGNEALTSDSSVENNVYILEEDISKRGMFEKHFIQSDGTYIAVTYSEPIHYDYNGEWIDVDNTIYYNEKIGSYKTSNLNFNAEFNKDISSSRLITLYKGNDSLSWNISFEGSSGKQAVNKSSVKTTVINNAEPVIADKAKKTEEEAFTLSKTSSTFKYENVIAASKSTGEIDLRYSVYQDKLEEDHNVPGI